MWALAEPDVKFREFVGVSGAVDRWHAPELASAGLACAEQPPQGRAVGIAAVLDLRGVAVRARVACAPREGFKKPLTIQATPKSMHPTFARYRYELGWPALGT